MFQYYIECFQCYIKYFQCYIKCFQCYIKCLLFHIKCFQFYFKYFNVILNVFSAISNVFSVMSNVYHRIRNAVYDVSYRMFTSSDAVMTGFTLSEMKGEDTYFTISVYRHAYYQLILALYPRAFVYSQTMGALCCTPSANNPLLCLLFVYAT